ncbi:MAG: D-ribulose kinase [Chroococcidiopsis cubana SAG 39.79]|uniref:D-ribulose kinase n=1 Tax=Chroococcidiopsis cubana SAG 39.79 TaxID=388085 RepID=A0AB37UN35_9CYAN|nr:FGGY-family carbohydrate kinase [Chroococcidiopsis cubana]MDZ4872853.1 D-ribulose kinase [Chroococcidiopsis cubana SAG 39.79]PSB61475.1 carbohydrate kinase [Chroococcidiopsis cubana CCALA 043]RUT12826.1 sugar kinase [Chroococcidiopsis cubana SAG 39.79]
MISLGIDFGTSGARAVAIDAAGKTLAEAKHVFTGSKLATAPAQWETGLFCLLEQLPLELRQKIEAIAIDGTSSTVLLCDATGNPIVTPLLYNDDRGIAVMDELRAIAPPHHVAIGATSSLAKLLWWQKACRGAYLCAPTKIYFLHQADWLSFLLHGQLGVSDYHNALKLGYDVERLCYPDWLLKLPALPNLPQILAPGTPVGEVTAEVRSRLGLPQGCVVRAGTTDSIAAFLASGANSPGEAVTSLGSTLVLKLLSRTRVEDARSGVYSHRLGDLWLAGGASNTGGAVLRHFFTDAELETLSGEIDPNYESPLDYYPLLKAGDRFPINDPHLPPRLEPRPENPVEFLHGLLESMARIEARGYQLLQQLGATPLRCVYTAGGGAKNAIWSQIRARHLGVPVAQSAQAEAAYGTALLAQMSC